MASQPSAGQRWALMVTALAVVLLSVGSTLYMNDIPAGFWGPEAEKPEPRYRQLTLAEAEIACKDHAREVFGRRLDRLDVDRFSSRLDRTEGQFKVFMEAEIYPNSSGEGVARYTFINCFTRIREPEVELFQYAKKDGQFIAPGEEGKGMFGL